MRLEDSSQDEGTVTSPKGTIEDKLKDILLEVWGYAYADGQLGQQPEGDDIIIALSKIQAIITTETTKARIDELEGMPHTTSIKPYVHERIAALQKEQNQ